MVKIQIILGSTRPNRQSEKVGRWVFEQVSKNSEIEVELIDLRDWPLPFYNEISGVMGLKGNFSVDLAKRWGQKISEADGYVIVTPEYNHGYPAVLKNALDYAYFEWNNKPVSFVAYGGLVGGSRSVEQLRLVAIELQMAPIREAVYIPDVWSAFDEKGNLEEEDGYNQKLDVLLKQLIWWAKVLKKARKDL